MSEPAKREASTTPPVSPRKGKKVKEGGDPNSARALLAAAVIKRGIASAQGDATAVAAEVSTAVAGFADGVNGV